MVKTITIKDEIFNFLSLQKGKDESFSDMFERLLNNQVSGILALKELKGSMEFDENTKSLSQNYLSIDNDTA
jgi:predicted CopG family antitoxin